MSIFKVQVMQAGSSKWYKHYVGQVFDVQESKINYNLPETKHNISILKDTPYIGRLMGSDSFGTGLGISKKDAFRIDISTNRLAASLLLKEEY